jgi:hypothetical protein
VRTWRRRDRAVPVRWDPDDPTLTVLVEAFDAARADSTVLAESGLVLDAPLLVRHHLVGLPDHAAVQRATEVLAQEDYVVRPGPGAPIALLACRTQILTALSLSQQRSRMAGLAQRLGGDVRGWDALGPSADTAAP